MSIAINHIPWPEGKDFAFTVFDDTDWGTVANLEPVYALLNDLGLKTTKSVWPLSNPNKPADEGSTCEDADYLQWLLKLQNQGFEIGYHLASYNSSTRDRQVEGLDRFRALFGHDPYTMASHNLNKDGLYWGSARLSSPITRLIYNASTKFKRNNMWEGHVKKSPYFWGDICLERIPYNRNFVFPDLNTLKACPVMPYYDAAKPWVQRWYASSQGSGITSWNKLVTQGNIDRLAAERGACIMYTHFSAGFYKNGKLNDDFKRNMEYLASKNGWFVPTNVLLDFLVSQKGVHHITAWERFLLEWKWLSVKIKQGRTS